MAAASSQLNKLWESDQDKTRSESTRQRAAQRCQQGILRHEGAEFTGTRKLDILTRPTGKSVMWDDGETCARVQGWKKQPHDHRVSTGRGAKSCDGCQALDTARAFANKIDTGRGINM